MKLSIYLALQKSEWFMAISLHRARLFRFICNDNLLMSIFWLKGADTASKGMVNKRLHYLQFVMTVND